MKSLAGIFTSCAAILWAQNAFAQANDTFFDDPLYKWNDAADDYCAYLDGSAPNPEIEARVDNVLDLIRTSRNGRALLDYGRKRGVAYCYNPKDYGGVVGSYLSTKKAFIIDPDEPLADEVKIAVHELRHMWQQENGYTISSFYKPRDLVLIGKVKEADAEAFANLVTYEIERAGNDIFGDTHEQMTYASVHDAFSEHANNNIPQAMRAAFDAWFSIDAAKTFYENGCIRSIESIIDISPNHYPDSYAYKELSDKDIYKMTMLFNGRSYLRQTGGFDRNVPLYSQLTEENEVKINLAIERTEQKRLEFCASRPAEEARFCGRYPTRPL